MKYIGKSLTNRLALKIEKNSVLITVIDGNFSVVLRVMTIKKVSSHLRSSSRACDLGLRLSFSPRSLEGEEHPINRRYKFRYACSTIPSLIVEFDRILYFRKETLLLEFGVFNISM